MPLSLSTANWSLNRMKNARFRIRKMWQMSLLLEGAKFVKLARFSVLSSISWDSVLLL